MRVYCRTAERRRACAAGRRGRVSAAPGLVLRRLRVSCCESVAGPRRHASACVLRRARTRISVAFACLCKSDCKLIRGRCSPRAGQTRDSCSSATWEVLSSLPCLTFLSGRSRVPQMSCSPPWLQAMEALTKFARGQKTSKLCQRGGLSGLVDQCLGRLSCAAPSWSTSSAARRPVAKALPYGPRRIDRTHSARLYHQRVDLRRLAARENL